MKVFNEETESKRNPQVILVLDKTEARDLVDMTQLARQTRPRKTTWKKLSDALAEKAVCW